MSKWQAALNEANLEKAKLKKPVLENIELLEASEQMVASLKEELKGITDPAKKKAKEDQISENESSIDTLDTEIAESIKKYAKQLANIKDMQIKKKAAQAAKKGDGGNVETEEAKQERERQESEQERLKQEEEAAKGKKKGSNIFGWVLLVAGVATASVALIAAAKKLTKK